MSGLLTPREVAAHYKVGVKTIWSRCQKGTMVPPPAMPGPPYRFSAAQVQQVLDGTYTAPAPLGTPRRFFAKSSRLKPRTQEHA
jgi:hypothetical protein